MADYETDVILTNAGELRISFIGHGTLMFTFEDQVIHVDPFSRVADFSKLPKANVVLLTHDHPDHLDLEALKHIVNDDTTVVLNESCAGQVKDGIIMKNGDVETVEGLKIEAVPAYNLVHKRDDGQPFHPKGVGNGYVITFGDKRIYIAGDTENIPEMGALLDIDCAFLPMNLPYTMTPEMAADAAKTLKPKILYPYHFGESDTGKLIELLQDETEIDVRIRNMQ